MSKTNNQTVQEYIEAMNQKQFDHIFDYCSPDCVSLGGPYVGLGMVFDDSSGKNVLLQKILPKSPAAGHLRAGDELVCVADAEYRWESFQELKSGLWGFGITGTPVTVTVRRGGKLLDIPLVRGRIEGSEVKLSEMLNSIRSYSLSWPDLKEKINLIFGFDDLVAVLSTLSGTNQKFQRSAVWNSCSIYRLHEGKIIEMMGVEDSFAQFKQLGYQISEPVRETAQ
jgi:hypothetical protein